MLTQRQIDATATTLVVVEAETVHGRDWALAVKVEKAVDLRVRVFWAGGYRDIVDVGLLPGDHDVELPKRIAGDRLEVHMTPLVAGGRLVAALSWTPDLAIVPRGASCG